jgi:acyl-CoA thioesterase
MFARDHTAHACGMMLEEVAAGRATLSMRVAETMVNGHAICHGGLIFTLADTAFAYACNGRDRMTVAQHCAVSFLAPAKLGDRLTARAVERWRQGRGGVYDVTVTDQAGRVIAEFRGNSREIDGRVIAGQVA